MILNYTAFDYGQIKPDKYGRFEVNKTVVAVNVEVASRAFGCSPRRIRQMLLDGKLKGTKYGKLWRIDYPYQIVMGRRGPILGYLDWKTRTSQRNIKDFTNLTFTKGE